MDLRIFIIFLLPFLIGAEEDEILEDFMMPAEVSLDCTFKYLMRYTCVLSDVVLPRNSIITNLGGIHQGGRSDKDVKDVIFQTSRLYTIPQQIFDRFENLDTVDVSNSNLETIQPINNCGNLRVLNLEKNRLSAIDRNALSECPMITRINLDYNQLSSLEQDQFLGLNRLLSLSLAHNSLTSINRGVFDSLGSLVSLTLSNNSISNIDEDAFVALSKLQILTIQFTLMENFPQKLFAPLVELQELHLGFNNINNLDEELFSSLGNLIKLDLQNNPNIKKITPQLLKNLINLKQLILNSDEIETFEDNTFDSLINLRDLRLSQNQIEFVNPRWFEKLAELQILFLDGNKIRSLPTNTFEGVRKLEVLYLSSNNFDNIDPALFVPLASLKNLYLSRNQLSQLHSDTFKYQSNLEILELFENQLTTIQEPLFQYCTNLKYLTLHSNRINRIDGAAFRNLKKLEQIRLSRNELQNLENNLFESNDKLAVINLDHNDLRGLSGSTFKENGNLAAVYLERNQIESLDKSFLDKMESNQGLQYLDFTNNVCANKKYDIANSDWKDIKNELENCLNGQQNRKGLVCEYQYSDYGYACFIRNVTILEEDLYFTITGYHLDDKQDFDVVAVFFRHSSMHHIPMEVFYKFQNTNDFFVDGNELKTVNKLKSCSNLKNFIAGKNQLRSLSKQVFAECPNLEVIDVQYNFIGGIEPCGFWNFRNLKVFNIYMNVCVSKIYEFNNGDYSWVHRPLKNCYSSWYKSFT